MDRDNRTSLFAMLAVLGLTGEVALADDGPKRAGAALGAIAAGPRDPGASAGQNLYNLIVAPQPDRMVDVYTSNIAWLVSDSDRELGAALTAVEDSVRTQLGLRAGEGLVVSNISPDGAAARVGLHANDILLSLGEKLLGKPEDLTLHLKSAGEKPTELHALRSGKPLTLHVKPLYRVTLGVVPTEKPEFYIGVPVQSPDDTLRAHLPNLPAGQGLLATEIQKDSPAAKAGLKPYDILLEFGGKPLKDMQNLIAQIQATGGKTTAMKILRGGREATIQVTPEPRKKEPDLAGGSVGEFWYPNVYAPVSLSWGNGFNQVKQAEFHPIGSQDLVNYLTVQQQSAGQDLAHERQRSEQLEKRLEDVLAELKKLRESIEAIQKGLTKN